MSELLHPTLGKMPKLLLLQASMCVPSRGQGHGWDDGGGASGAGGTAFPALQPEGGLHICFLPENERLGAVGAEKE